MRQLAEGFRIETFREEHCLRAAGIEHSSFSNPWPDYVIEEMLCTGEGHFGLACVRESDGRLVAYGGVQYAADQGDVTNIATDPEFRRLGCARALLSSLAEKCRSLGLQELFLEVRQSNSGARSLYESFGFEYLGIRKKYYDNPREDACIMVYHIGSADN